MAIKHLINSGCSFAHGYGASPLTDKEYNPIRQKGLDKLTKKFNLGAGLWNSSDSVLDNISQPDDLVQENTEIDEMGIEQDILIVKLRKEMHQAAERLDFERAASIRDRIYQIENATD